MDYNYLIPSARDYFHKKIEKLSNSQLRIFDRNKNINIEKVKHVHITGVCGTATASLAKLFLDQGISVSGSDQDCYQPMRSVLEEMNIIVKPFDIENVKNTDLVIIANMCPPNNIEATYCRENNIAQLSMSEAIREFAIRDKKTIVIAGTHGKTTTTGMGIHVLDTLGLHPSFLVGGVQKSNGKSAQFNSKSNYFVIEGDEYDTAYFDKSPKFLHYKPYYTIITSIELDHIDIYENFEDYLNSFRFLIETTDINGKIIICIDDEGGRKLFNEYSSDPRVISYGTSSDAIVSLHTNITKPNGETAIILWNEKEVGYLEIPMFGIYNLLNALSIYIVASCIGFDHLVITNSFMYFQGMKRRQEIFGNKNGITIIDDFAHHPTAVQKTLSGIRSRFPNQRIIVLFEPRSNTSRSKIFETEYVLSFNDADIIVFSTPKPKDGYNPPEFMDVNIVINELNSKSKEAYSVNNAVEAVQILTPMLVSNDIVVVMSNGSFDGVHKKLLDNI